MNVTDIRSRMAPAVEFDDSVPERLRESITRQIAETMTRLHTAKVRVTEFKDGDVVLAFVPAAPVRNIKLTATVV